MTKQKNNELSSNSSSIITSAYYQGPLPPASQMEKYDKIIPEGANRIMIMAEEQAKHRRYLEKISIEEDIKREKRAQHYAFIIGLIGIIFAFILLLFDKNLAGFSIFIGELATFIAIYLHNSYKEKQEKKDKKMT